MQDKKVLTIQDFSSFGQCSISVALPIISAMGSEVIALPVAVLSTHTSEFKNYEYVDLSSHMLDFAKHIRKYCPDTYCIYTGYLGKSKTVKDVKKIIELYPSAKLIVDPAMAEGGELYDGITDDYVDEISDLCKHSDLCLPNFTEACLLAGMKYTPRPDKDFTTSLAKTLFSKGIKNFAVTGIDKDERICVLIGNNGDISEIETCKIQGKYYGAGDVFSAVVAGAVSQGKSIRESLELAIDFTGKAVEETSKDASHWYGLKFERLLPWLISKKV